LIYEKKCFNLGVEFVFRMGARRETEFVGQRQNKGLKEKKMFKPAGIEGGNNDQG